MHAHTRERSRREVTPRSPAKAAIVATHARTIIAICAPRATTMRSALALRRLALASSLGGVAAASLVHRPTLSRDMGLDALTSRISALEALSPIGIEDVLQALKAEFRSCGRGSWQVCWLESG